MLYQEWEKELANISEREKQAAAEVKEKQSQLKTIRVKYDQAVIEGASLRKLSDQLAEAEKELQQAEHKSKAFLNGDRKNNKRLQQIGEAVIKENVEALKEYQKQIDESVKTLQELKERFYTEVKELGKLSKEATRTSNRTMGVNKAITEKARYFGVSLNANDTIYFDNRTIDRCFRGVDY